MRRDATSYRQEIERSLAPRRLRGGGSGDVVVIVVVVVQFDGAAVHPTLVAVSP